MEAVWIALASIFAIGVALAVYALMAPRRKAERERLEAQRAPLQAQTEWTLAVGQEFSTLSESARCDMIFALTALEDERSERLLEHALDDPSEAVALAAARALVTRGQARLVDRHLTAHPGERAERIAHTLALIAPEP